MEKFLELVSQRRVWAGVLGVVAFLVTTLNLSLELDVPVLTDLLTAFGVALVALVQAGLALWSYFQPKK